MANSSSGVFGALGAVLGYIGAEVATPEIYHHLLWPQRFYSNATIQTIPIIALLMPIGDPLHSVALETLDVFFKFGLFKGHESGHMLGTAFYNDQQWIYTSSKITCTKGSELLQREVIKSEFSRNCLWISAVKGVPIPDLPNKSTNDSGEKGDAKEPHKVRAKYAVSHLILSKATDEDKKSEIQFVQENVGFPSFAVFATIVTAEFSAIVVAITLILTSKSAWAAWWLVPLILRLVSACFALNRDQLINLEAISPDEDNCDFEIKCPSSDGNFMLISGPRPLVEQFFTHYGHPARDRLREVIQLAVVVISGAFFPFGLFCSVIWMPIDVQYFWLCYQLYVVFAMLVVRYGNVGLCASVEANISNHFANIQSPKSDGRSEILFGHTRDGNETIKINFSATYKKRYLDGQQAMDELMGRKITNSNSNY